VPKGLKGNDVYANKLDFLPELGANITIDAGVIDGVACAVTANASTGVYGIKDVKTNADKQVCLWLPANSGTSATSATSAGVSLSTADDQYGLYYTRAANTLNTKTLYNRKVSYDLDGGTYNNADAVHVIYVESNESNLLPGGSAYEATKMTKTGYTFSGGDVAYDGKDPLQTGVEISNESTYEGLVASDATITDITLVAKWALDLTVPDFWASISYSADDATGGTVPEVQYFESGTNATLAANDGNAPLVRTGYTFDGWYWEDEVTETTHEYAPGDTWENIPAGIYTLYAKWDARAVDVAFDVDEGSAVGSTTGTYDDVLTTAPENPAKSGYTFGGWYWDADLDDAHVFTFDGDDPGTPLNTSHGVTDYETPSETGNASLTLYAKWTPIASTPATPSRPNPDPNNGEGDDPNDNGSDVDNGNDGDTPDSSGNNGANDNGGTVANGGVSTPTVDAGTPAQPRTGTTGVAATGNAANATATATEIGDTDTPLSDIPGNDTGSENDADRGYAPSTDTEINPSDTPLGGGNGQAFALGTALPIAGAALAAALLSIFLILFLRRRKKDEEEA
jgi:uncharacterized repeat protein (TIGR02543 family)